MQYAVILFGVMIVLLIFGVPIAYAIGLAGTILLWTTGLKDLILIPQRTIIGMDSFVMLAIPLFTLSGYLMEEGGLSKRLVDWAERLFGFFPGSSGTIAIISSTVFAALTGSGPATVAAIGALMMPVMIKSGYPKRVAGAFIAAAGALGPIIPPSIPMIVYGSSMNVSIPSMFAGSLLPGLVIAGLLIGANTWYAKTHGILPEDVKYTVKEKALFTWKALPVLMLPIIVLGGIYGGFFTPTEAASVCMVYALILSIFYKSLTIPRLINACKKTVLTSAMVMAVVGIANLFGWILSTTRIPALITQSVIPYCNTKFKFYVIVLVILLLVGCLMDTISSILILGPILSAIAIQLGIDPLHFGIIFCITLIIGFITPPFGVNLFTICSTSDIPFTEVVKGVWPLIVVEVVGVVIVILFPQLCLFLPSILAG